MRPNVRYSRYPWPHHASRTDALSRRRLPQTAGAGRARDKDAIVIGAIIIMSKLPKLTQNDVRRLASAQSFQRGEDYVYAVFKTQRRGDTLTAQVEGSQYEPYHVTVTLDQAGIYNTLCSCPYDWGGICKHIVAVLLTYICSSDSFAVRIAASELLADLDAKTLRTVLVDLLEHYPDLQDEVEAQLAVQQARSAPAKEETKSSKRRSPLDPAPIRRRVTGILHSLSSMRHSEAYWAVGGMVEQLGRMLQEAQDFVDADDAESALVILQVLGEQVIETYPTFEYAETDVADFIMDVDDVLAEAILACDLPPDLEQKWGDTVTYWTKHLEDYGIDDAMDIALAALGRWDAEFDEKESVPALSSARLNILERRGETDAFLALALETGQHLRYALKLIELKREQEAIEHAREHFEQAWDALTLATRLRETGNVSGAVLIAERGLELKGHKHNLGVWLADAAAGLGQTDLALRARIVAYEAQPSLKDYQAVQKQAGERWPELQPQLMDAARQSLSKDLLVDILLYEGLVDEAIAIAEQERWNYHLLEKVVDKVIATRPDWVIRVSQEQAEGLINKVQSKYYVAAVRWLEKARAAYLAADQKAKWRAYLADLRERHNRKRTLMGMLTEMDQGEK